jgi:hypothetical protein
MNQTNDLSTLVARMVTGVVNGVMTEVTSARRRNNRKLFLVVIAVMGVTFAITVLFLNPLPGNIVTPAENRIFAPAPARGRRPEPTPRTRDDAEDLRRLTRPNPM